MKLTTGKRKPESQKAGKPERKNDLSLYSSQASNEVHHRGTEGIEKERGGDINSIFFCVLSVISAPLR